MDFLGAGQPMIDMRSVLAPGALWLGLGLEAGALKALTVLGKSDAAVRVVDKASAMQAFVRPPDVAILEACFRDRTRCEERGVKRGRLENAEARRGCAGRPHGRATLVEAGGKKLLKVKR